MNEERMPINLFKLDIDNGHEMTEAEMKQQKRQDVQPWIFLISICLCAGIVFIFIVIKGHLDLIGLPVALFALLIALIVLSVYKIIKIRNTKI